MRFEFIDVERAQSTEIPLRIYCRAMRVTLGGYHAWKTRKPSARSEENATLCGRIVPLFDESNGTYGPTRMHQHLSKEGFEVGRNRVARLMHAQGLSAYVPKKHIKTTDSNHDKRVAPNLVERRFYVDKPNTLWLVDISVPQLSGLRDGGRSSEVSVQAAASNYRKRPWSKALVVSVTEKVHQMYQVRTTKMNTREPPFTRRKQVDGIKTGVEMLLQDKFGECLLIGQAVSGVEAA